MQRACALVPEAGGRQHTQPEVAAAARQIIELAGGLADRPDHSEITDRRAGSTLTAFKNDHAAPAFRQVVSVRQAYYAGAGYRVIEYFCAIAHHSTRK
jgi:hypothetical protein